jgi:hypothetical protein
MKRFCTLITTFVLMAPFAVIAAAELSTEDQIAQAVSPLPESMRASATVVTYDAKGEPVVLREGAGSVVCTPDQHREGSFAVSCYQKVLRTQRDMEAKLRAEGKDQKAIQAEVQAARDSGKLPTPPQGTMMYMRSGKIEAEAHELWVMLMPGATAESTGLPTSKGQGSPWLMRAGTPGAHVMMPQSAPMSK